METLVILYSAMYVELDKSTRHVDGSMSISTNMTEDSLMELNKDIIDAICKSNNFESSRLAITSLSVIAVK